MAILRRIACPLTFVIACALTLPGGAIAQDATPPALIDGLTGLGLPELHLVITTEGIEAPSQVEADRYLVVLENATQSAVDVTFFQLPAGLTQAELEATPVAEEEVPDWLYEALIAGGAVAGPGQTGQAVIDLVPGEWLVDVFQGDEDTAEVATPEVLTEATPQFGPVADEEAMSQVLTLTVTEPIATPAPPHPPRLPIPADVHVEMDDYAFSMPTALPAGPQIWEVTNVGAEPHFIVLVKGPDDLTEEQVEAILAAEFGEEPRAPDLPDPETDFEEAGFVSLLSAGQTLWVEFDLEPGTYVALCFFPERETGMPHAAMGMYELVTVSEADATMADEAAVGLEVTIESFDIVFVPDEVTIPADTDVTFVLPNRGSAPHNFSIEELGIDVDIGPGATAEVIINAPAGTYEFICDIPGHAEAGMVGTLIVE